MSKCTNDLSKRVIITLHDNFFIFFYWNNVSQEVLRFMYICVCVHEFVCVCSFVSRQSIRNQKYARCCPHVSFLKKRSSDCTIPCSSIFKEVLSLEDLCVFVCVYVSVRGVLCCVILCVTVCMSVLCEQAVRSRVDAKGQQFVRVQVVEGAQVRQAQEEFGEEGGVVRATASDQRPQGTDETLL